MSESNISQDEDSLPQWSWWGLIMSALGAQLCCGLPTLLLSLGISGSLIAQLQAVKPFRPLFLLTALGFLLAGWLSLRYRRRQGCPLPQPRG